MVNYSDLAETQHAQTAMTIDDDEDATQALRLDSIPSPSYSLSQTSASKVVGSDPPWYDQ